MGRIIIFCVLAITVPRWAGAFLSIDKFTIGGVPITAVGTGIAMGLGVYHVIDTIQSVSEDYKSKLASWTAHDDNMKAQGKSNHKPKPERPRSIMWLDILFVTLLTLTTISQTPYIVNELVDSPISDLLDIRGLWGYGIVLVLSPEIVVAAVALASHERGELETGKRKKGKVSISIDSLLDRLSDTLGDIRGTRSDTDEREVSVRENDNLTCFCGKVDTKSRRGLSSHMRVHKAEALKHETPTQAFKWFLEQYAYAYNGKEYDMPAPDRETIERWFSD